MKIGVGVTTRSRHESAAFTIKKIVDHSGDCRVLVVDDNSDSEQRTQPYGHAEIFYATERLGVARAKNKCLELLEDCDYIFLFDDDCFPKVQQWWVPFTNASATTGNHHFMYIGADHYGFINKINDVTIWQGASGQMMMVSQKVLQVVGGFQAHSNYGYEHIRYTHRIHRAGLTPYGSNLSVANAKNLLHSFDNDGHYPGINWPSVSSISETEKAIEIARAGTPEAVAAESSNGYTPYK